MKEENLHKVAEADTSHLKSNSFGYAINLVMDYGSGRQVRKATNRQQAYVIMRDCEAKERAERKMSEAMEHMLKTYETGMESEMKRISDSPESMAGASGKLRTVVSAQLESMRSQALNHKLQQQQQIDQHKTNAEINAVTIASLQKEIEELNQEG